MPFCLSNEITSGIAGAIGVSTWLSLCYSTAFSSVFSSPNWKVEWEGTRQHHPSKIQILQVLLILEILFWDLMLLLVCCFSSTGSSRGFCLAFAIYHDSPCSTVREPMWVSWETPTVWAHCKVLHQARTSLITWFHRNCFWLWVTVIFLVFWS